ncbi:hypothetical protein ABD87_14805 [Lysinibacillus sphaericus]|uniref:hypothetical protein n=1 Tax=Lysinibacillus sphaericus TaxID=1421 RepID=UPI0018CCEE45|nr:hypothetical protein [Lysinibacillus sphaericus]MBG9730766.1 hypothetical protein [Lysinibacillus sphaericus]
MINFVNVIEKYEMVKSYIPDVMYSKHDIREDILKIFKDDKNTHELYLESSQWEKVKLNNAIEDVKMVMQYLNTLSNMSLENMLQGKSIYKFFCEVCDYYSITEFNIANIVPNNKFTQNLFLYLNDLIERNIIRDFNLKDIYDWQLSNYVVALYPTIKQIFEEYSNYNALETIIKVSRELPSSVIPTFENEHDIISFFQSVAKLTPWYFEKDIMIHCDDYRTMQILSELSIEFERFDATALNLFLSKVKSLGFSIDKVREIYQIKRSRFIDDVIQLKGQYLAELPENEISRYLQYNIDLTEIVYGKKSYKVMESVQDYLKGFNMYYSNEEEKLKGENRLFRFFARIKNTKGAINFFEKAIQNNNADLKNMGRFSPLYSEFVIKNVSINNLNDNTFKKMVDMGYYQWSSLYPRLDKKDLPSKITPEEYFVYRDLNEFCQQIYDNLIIKDSKVDVRLRTIQSIASVNVDLLKEHLNKIDSENFTSIFMQNASILLNNTQSIHFANKFPSMDKTYAFLCFVLETISENFAECQTNGDVQVMLYAMNTLEEFKEMTLEEAKIHYYKNHHDMNEAQKFLGLSDLFYSEHRESLANFVLNGNFKIVKTHYANTNANKNIANVKLLAKAEIAGKLKEIRLSKQGLEKELNTSINNTTYDAWEKDMVKNHDKNRLVYENSNFQDFMLYGVYPVDSCMHYEDGEYSHCMLSIFDSNKKLLYVKQKGVIVGRAILRFTKYTTNRNEAVDNNLNSELDGLQFNDVDGVHDTETINHKSAIFLERLYTSVDDNSEKEIKALLVELATQKAKDMGVELITSTDYEDILFSENTNVDRKKLYVYISKSKNGNQYLDSLDGYSTENKGGSFVSVTLPLVKFN